MSQKKGKLTSTSQEPSSVDKESSSLSIETVAVSCGWCRMEENVSVVLAVPLS